MKLILSHSILNVHLWMLRTWMRKALNLWSLILELYTNEGLIQMLLPNISKIVVWHRWVQFLYSFHYKTLFKQDLTNSLYIRLQELRIISFSVVNMTEKLQCCQLDLGFFSVIGKIYSKESWKEKEN